MNQLSGNRGHMPLSAMMAISLTVVALVACTGKPDMPAKPTAAVPPAPPAASTPSVPSGWKLDVHDSSGASMAPIPDTPGAIRVAIPKSTGVRWHVQLNGPGIPMTKGETYFVTFRARVAKPRTISVGVAQAHAPWENLGYYRDITIATTWTAISDSFVVTKSDSVTRLHFDLGANAESVDVVDMTLSAKRPGKN